MAFISLGEAVARVLDRLEAQQREERGGKVVSLPAKAARVTRGGAAPALARGEHHAAPAETGVTATRKDTPAKGSRIHVITTGPEQPSIGKLKLRHGERRSEIRRLRS